MILIQKIYLIDVQKKLSGGYMTRFFKYIFIFLCINLFSNTNISYPITTQGGTPNLSVPGTQGYSAEIADATGQYVYAIWNITLSGSDFPVQVGISSDYGRTWINPQSTPSDLGPPYLSLSTNESLTPQITTDETGKYVYAIWARDKNGLSNQYITQVAISSDYGNNWTNPLHTMSDLGSPNLSQSGRNSQNPQIACSATGQYIYAIWQNSPVGGGNYIIQVGLSSDYGRTWQTPTSTNSDLLTPNLSMSTSNSQIPQIVTSSSGKYVHVIWQANIGGSNYPQVCTSSDFGQTWNNPTTLPQIIASNPQIATSSSGQYVYVIWQNNTNPFPIQVMLSSDFGLSWQNPLSTPTGTTPNLSISSNGPPQIDTSSSGEYVFAIWTSSNGPNFITQVAISSDYGKNWTNPISTPVSPPQPLPDLSLTGTNAFNGQIATNSSGEFVYAVWDISSVGGEDIQMAISNDFGKNWVNPTTTPVGINTPNLTNVGFNISPQVVTNLGGKYVHVVWEANPNTIQEANGINNQAQIPQLQGAQVKNRFPLAIELANTIGWDFDPNAVKYLIYSDAALTHLVAEIFPPNLEFIDHQIKKCERKTYYVTWVDMNGNISTPSSITLP